MGWMTEKSTYPLRPLAAIITDFVLFHLTNLYKFIAWLAFLVGLGYASGSIEKLYSPIFICGTASAIYLLIGLPFTTLYSISSVSFDALVANVVLALLEVEYGLGDAVGVLNKVDVVLFE